MNKIFLIICIILSVTVFPQDKRYFDTPMGGGGGYVPGWYFHKIDPLNQQLKTLSVPALSENGTYSSGGAGFIYLMFIPNIRVGGMGFGGTASSKNSYGGDIAEKEAMLSFGGGGVTIEYTLPFIKSIGVSPGILIGGGYQKIELYSNNGVFNWNNIWNEFETNSSANRYSLTLENNYWILSPTLNIDIPFYRFFIFRIGAGYNFSLGNDWTAENDKEIAQVPSELNGDGFFIQSGIFIGFFSF